MDQLNDIVHRSRSMAAPAAILALASIGLYLAPSADPAWAEMLRVSPYLAAVTGMLLAVHFHRGRPFILLLILAIFYWCYRSFLAGGAAGPEQHPLYHALCCLLPANAFAFTLVRERGVFTEVGKFRLIYLAGQAFLAYLVFHYNFAELAPLFDARLRIESMALPQVTCILFLAAAIGIAVLAFLRKTPFERGGLGFLVALFVACSWLATPNVTTLFSLAAAAMVIVGILQESYNLAFRDDLTGIPSRRALNETLYGLEGDFAIAMVDVDHFKKFNDTHGHDVGDQVLKLVAKKLSGVGGGGRQYRYGGEEFTILFEGKRAAEAAPHLEALRREIADYRMMIRGDDRPKDDRKGKRRGTGSRTGQSVAVTVSIGLADDGPDRRTPEEVIIAADKALYKAKEQGRNQVCLAR